MLNKQTNKQTKEQKESNMKIKNIAFFGVMASILTVAGANATIATNVTKIASQQYVDAKDAATLSTAQTYTDTKIEALDNSFTASDGKPVTSITEENGVVSASTGTITTAAFDSTTLKTTVGETGSDTALVTEAAVRNAITAATNTINGNVTTATNALTETDGDKTTNVTSIKGMIAGSNLISGTGTTMTVAAGSGTNVATTAQISTDLTALKGEIDTNRTNIGTNASAISSLETSKEDVANKQTGTTWTAGMAGENAATKYPTMAILDSAISTVNGTVAGLDMSEGDGSTGVILTVTQTDGQVAATSGQVETGMIADNAVTTGKIEDGTIANADISNTAAIDYSKMNNDLKNVNTDADVTCSADDPCMLVNIGGEFKWSKIAYAEPTPVANTPVTPGSGD